MIFILTDVKNRVPVKNNDKISVTWIFLDPIKNRVSVKSVYVEAVYLEALLYVYFIPEWGRCCNYIESKTRKYMNPRWHFR